jgi:hypothetical protein
LTDPDSDNLKAAAEYLLQHPQPDTRVHFQLIATLPTPILYHSVWPDSRTRTKRVVARSSEGRRYRKQPKMDALREFKAEIVEAHRSGLYVYRIAEISGKVAPTSPKSV